MLAIQMVQLEMPTLLDPKPPGGSKPPGGYKDKGQGEGHTLTSAKVRNSPCLL